MSKKKFLIPTEMFISCQMFKKRVLFLNTWALILISCITILFLEIKSLPVAPQGSVYLVGLAGSWNK